MTVGVVITCHNEADYIGDAIRSVQRQTRPVDALGVVNDGSTDNSKAEIVRCLGVPGVWTPGLGMAEARNIGLRTISTDYVIHLDGDDWLEPNFVETTLGYATASGHVDAVQTSIVRHPGGWAPAPVPVTLASMVERCTLHSCALFRREALLAAGGFRSDLGGDCDWGAWVELLARGSRIGYTNDTAYNYRRRPGSLTSRETAADRARHHALIRQQFA